MRPNPFNPGSMCPDQYLFGRTREWDLVQRATSQIVAENRGHHPICFLASAGLGKTTLLKKIALDLRKKDWFCGYSEASPEAATALHDLLADAGEAFARRGLSKRLIRRVTGINVKAGPVGLDVALGNSDETTAYTQVVKFLSEKCRAAKRHHSGIALLLDEAQVLPSSHMNLLLRAIRRLDSDMPIILIMGGLSKVVNNIGSKDQTNPYVEYCHLGPLSQEEAFHVLNDPMVDARAELLPEASAKLTEFANGHPLTLQLLGSSAWVEADRQSLGDDVLTIQETHAVAAISNVRSQLRTSYYQPMWSSCDKREKAVLRALASRDLSNPDSLYRLMLESWAVIQRLEERGVISQYPLLFAIPGFEDFITGK